MKTLFITATNTDVGKTYTTLKLLELYARLGYRVGVMKPIETGVKNAPKDATRLFKKACTLNPVLNALTLDDICPIRFTLPAAPIVANNLEPIDLAPLKKSYDKLNKMCDLILIEGAGGLLTPINLNFYMADLIPFFDAKALLVCDDALGAINQIHLNLHYLASQKIAYEWIINQRDPHFEQISKPYLQAHFGKVETIEHDLATVARRLLDQ